MAIELGVFPVVSGGVQVGTVTVTQDGLMTAVECRCRPAGSGVMRLYGVSGERCAPLGVPVPEGTQLYLKKRFTRSALADMGLEGTPEYQLSGADGAPSAMSAKEREHTPAPREAERTPPEPIPEPMPPPESADSEEDAAPEPTVKTLAAPGWAGRGEDIAVSQVRASPPGWTYIQNPSELFSDREIAGVCRDVKGALTSKQGSMTLLAVPVEAGEPFPMMPIFCFGYSQELDGREYAVFKIKNGSLEM